jgi:hypothetical protein
MFVYFLLLLKFLDQLLSLAELSKLGSGRSTALGCLSYGCRRPLNLFVGYLSYNTAASWADSEDAFKLYDS